MEKKKKKLITYMAILIGILAAAYILSRVLNPGTNGALAAQETDTSRDRNYAAPAFTLLDGEGNSHSLSDYRGKYVILNFWGSWCVYCVREMPDFEAADAVFKEQGDTVIIAINDTSTEKSLKTAMDFVENNSFKMLVVYDLDGSVADLYNVSGYPTTYVVDKEGFIYGYQSGSLTKENLFDVIERLRMEDEENGS